MDKSILHFTLHQSRNLFGFWHKGLAVQTINHNSRPPANADPDGCRIHILVVATVAGITPPPGSRHPPLIILNLPSVNLFNLKTTGTHAKPRRTRRNSREGGTDWFSKCTPVCLCQGILPNRANSSIFRATLFGAKNLLRATINGAIIIARHLNRCRSAKSRHRETGESCQNKSSKKIWKP